ncbi:L-amino acid N-acyltransferase YncA [Pullulanibacillus pueri]|uniref:Acetyltransferase n=1 Tax=Pullulanibacillus pueri TaxID=1437324 RepID=A0A8J3A0C3_9BACL|nr:GNAT family N-acetyltransferase [Pullulanibacillus pueri]MBM7683761.1 L-amino acid N-acyltransferase YncA [Pullulanibacillus pueri]GGH87320.1 acetyltransferase [Pullulanibacillus pueri]
MTIKIREAVIEDAAHIAHVQVESWKTTYKDIVSEDYLSSLDKQIREERWQKIISEAKTYVFVAEEEKGTIVGFSSGGIERTKAYAQFKGELYAIYILEDYQYMGIGTELVRSLVQKCLESDISSMLVWVLEDNTSRHFYEKLGAIEVNQEEITIGDQSLIEVAYGWLDLNNDFKA